MVRIAIVLLILGVLIGFAALILASGTCRGLQPVEECAPYRSLTNLLWPVVGALGIASLVMFMLGARTPKILRAGTRERGEAEGDTGSPSPAIPLGISALSFGFIFAVFAATRLLGSPQNPIGLPGLGEARGTLIPWIPLGLYVVGFLGVFAAGVAILYLGLKLGHKLLLFAVLATGSIATLLSQSVLSLFDVSSPSLRLVAGVAPVFIAVATVYLVGLRLHAAAFTVGWVLLAMSLYAILAVMLCPPGVMSFPRPAPFPTQYLLCLVWPLLTLLPLAFFAIQFFYVIPRARKKSPSAL